MSDPATIVAIVGIAQEARKGPLGIIKLQIKYITDFKKIVADFRTQLELFEARKNDVQEMVDRSHRNLQEAGKKVEFFLRQCNEFQSKYSDNLNFLKGLNVEMVKRYGRYKISKKALSMEEKIKTLMVQFNYELPKVINPPPRAVIELPADFHESLGSVERVKIQVMAAIKDADKTMIGLYGMGGVGKTTLMERINNELLIDNSHGFTYVIMVTVSATPNISKLQNDIAKRVGYKDLENISDIYTRGCMLKERLRKEKSILIILDDVWKRLNLNKIGILCGCSGENDHCKVVLTTRNADVCKQMDVEPIIPMACLNFDESWKLFEEKSGAIESESIRAIAEDVCKECAGLPLAISVVALALKNEKEERIWVYFLSKLKESNIKDLDGIELEVYLPLKLSYDHLESDDCKLCFLFCSLFSEDHEIHLDDLIYYGIGEGFVACYEGVSSLDYTLILISKV